MKNLSRKKILVIDDSETNLVLLKAVLEDAGYEVELAESAKKAHSLFDRVKPDLILLDLLMPNEDGFMFLSKMDNGSADFLTPVIVVTAYANEENKQKAKGLGAKDIIEKPIDIPEFLLKINNALNE
jgi:CheY-like chemotaxis protein